MKFFLINPDYMLYGDPPLGLASLASYVRENCPFLEIRILDQLNKRDILKMITKERPEFIGISAVSQNYYFVLDLAKEIKKITPNSFLILGGVHVTVLPNSFNNSPFDLAIRGEGEIPTTKFFNSIREFGGLNKDALSKIKGLLFRQGKEVINTGISEMVKILDDIPLPAYDLLNMNFYTLPRFSHPELKSLGSLITSRGCPYSCRFCGSSAFWNRTIRFFSATRVVEEIKILHNVYGYKSICIYDDLFSINKNRLKEIVTLLEEEGLLGKIKFDALARANCFDEEIAVLLRKMGVYSLTFGFESGSQKILNYLKRESVTLEQGYDAAWIAKKHGFLVSGFFMLGSPGETIEDINKTFNFIKKLELDSEILFQLKAYPGTECWDYALKNNILKGDFYNHKPEDFIDINLKYLLSRDISPNDFLGGYNNIKDFIINKKSKRFTFHKLKHLRLNHLKLLFNKTFITKSLLLRKKLLKQIGIIK